MDKTKDNKNSLPLALILSLLVCLAGSIVWGLIYSFGFITSIIAAITTILAISVWRKFKKVNYVTYLWVLFWVIILNECAILISLNFVFMKELGSSYTFAESFQILFKSISSNKDFLTAIISDSIWSIVFSVLGAVIEMVGAKKRAKNNADSQNLNKAQENSQVAQDNPQETPQQNLDSSNEDSKQDSNS